MSKKDKITDIYIYIKQLNSKGKYKDVVKYADKFMQIKECGVTRYKKVKFMKAKALRQLERYEEAIEILKSEIENDDCFYMLELFFLYYHLSKYEEALKLLPTLYNYENKTIRNFSLSIMELVMKKHLGYEITCNDQINDDNIKMQIINYNEEKAIKSIKDHTIENINDFDSKSYFNKNIDIDYLIECIKQNIKTSKKINKDECLEVHYFLVPGIGIYRNNTCNYIKIVLIPNTTNIITAYPTLSQDECDVPILNCNFDILFGKKEKVKSL